MRLTARLNTMGHSWARADLGAAGDGAGGQADGGGPGHVSNPVTVCFQLLFLLPLAVLLLPNIGKTQQVELGGFPTLPFLPTPTGSTGAKKLFHPSDFIHGTYRIVFSSPAITLSFSTAKSALAVSN